MNARLIEFAGMESARDEILKIGVDERALPWLLPKALHIAVKLHDLSCFSANVIKQEMLGAGGDAAVHRGSVNCSIPKTDVLILGTFDQYNKLIYKLGFQSGNLAEIAVEIKLLLENIEKPLIKTFDCGSYKLEIGRKTLIMGILNVTPDSFSDGGKYENPEDAVQRALQMVEDGADIIDVGGESTRPGHEEVDAETELKRVVPVIEKLANKLNVPISVDTTKAQVARSAISAGASIINDVWGLQKEAELAGIAAGAGAGVVLMHNKTNKSYDDLMGEIVRFLSKSVEIAENAGISRNSIAVDPGMGFGKTFEQNLETIRRLKEMKSMGLPIALGTSRKSFIGKILDAGVEERIEGTAATVAVGIAEGADIVRVHDVKEMAKVAAMTDAMIRSK